MKGFDQKFKDFPDYILGITKEIWEDRGISTLHSYYGKDMYLRMPLGTSRGNSGVIAKTMDCLLYTSPSPRDATLSRMPSSA